MEDRVTTAHPLFQGRPVKEIAAMRCCAQRAQGLLVLVRSGQSDNLVTGGRQSLDGRLSQGACSAGNEEAQNNSKFRMKEAKCRDCPEACPDRSFIENFSHLVEVGVHVDQFQVMVTGACEDQEIR
jgi:hypothetical protein